MPTDFKAVIAEDEPLLLIELRDMLANLWPDPLIAGRAEGGIAAMRLRRSVRSRQPRRHPEDAGRHRVEEGVPAVDHGFAGQRLRLNTVDWILYIKSDHKYTIVVTEGHESLIRRPIKEVVHALDPNAFWKIRRGTLVNVNAITGHREPSQRRFT
jgi:hypothetical protein